MNVPVFERNDAPMVDCEVKVRDVRARGHAGKGGRKQERGRGAACLSINVEIVDDIAESDAGLADGYIADKNNFNLGRSDGE